NGINAYFQWNDDLSWYPHGRDVSQTSQVVLHMTAAITHWIFGGGMELYDFTILFPVIFGSLSAIVIFALVRVIGGTTAGLFSALFFSVSLPLILRGTIGWFKSEPLGLFFGLLATYFLLSGINSKNKKIAIAKLITAGIIIPLSISAWGGSQFFIIPIGVFFLTLPFVRSDHKFIIWAIPLFTTTAVLGSLSFERLTNFIFGLGGASLIIPTIFIIACIFIQSKSNENKKTRNGLLFLASILIFGTCILIINADTEFLPLPSYRYLNAINPFLTTSVPLVDSVAEHASTTIDQSFLFHSILMIFAGLGIWLIIKNYQIKNSGFIKNDMILFSLIFGLIGIYVSSAFVRLEVFASLSLIILSSIGLSVLVKEILKNNTESKKFKNLIIKSSFLVGIIILLVIPISFPSNGNWVTAAKIPPTILNGGTAYPVSTNDWLESMEWIKNNTPKDAVIASWWDYGYWISTLGERATIADNSTISTAVIQNLAKMLMNSPERGWQMLRDMQADYVVVFVSGQRLTVDNEDQALYVLQGGGDESKKQWFIRIAEEPLTQYLQSDGITGTDYFWNDTLLGKMFPFTPLAYINFQTNEQSATYQPGFT
ncbi:MAG: STT3 domain-containing protein, partial [Thermoproteota archaeon]